MGYQPHLISKFASGLNTILEPWILPDDAQESLLDGYVQHGVINNREGYKFYANGLEGSAPYCESRMVSNVTGEAMTGAVDSANQTYTQTAANLPVRRGTYSVSSDTPAQTVTDAGDGSFTGNGTGTINYVTGVVSVTFDAAPTAGTVTSTYDYYPGLPVMMVAKFVTATNIFEMILADTDNLNKYNSTTNRLDDITNRTYTGSNKNFFDWTQYPTVLDTPRLIFSNNIDPIQSYNGTSTIDWYPVYEGTDIVDEILASGTGITGPYTGTTSNQPVMPGTVVINADPGGVNQEVTDDGAGVLLGAGTGTINYTTGAISVTFDAVVAAAANNIVVDYTYGTGYVQAALKVIDYKDRMVILRPTEVGGTIHPQRIRISGTGSSGDDFRVTASGAGIIDIPDQNWIMGADFNRDDLIIYTARSTWMLKYTGNDIVPFTLVKIDGSRGNRAPFAPISYLNFTKAYSPQEFTVTDGYELQQFDQSIENYGFESIDQENFDLCFSGAVDDDQNHYLIHPSPEQATSDKILVNNYDENNFAVFNIPLSCMGQYFFSFDTTWSDLTEANGFENWKDFGIEYSTWNDISYSKAQPISIGGGHLGEVWWLNGDSGEDNPLRVWGVTEVSTGLIEFTTDWHNYAEGDYIFVSGLAGSTEINDKQGFIPESGIIDDHTIRVQFSNVSAITAWTEGGKVSRTIPFEFTTKNFNPYSEANAKVRCGWVYFYLNISESSIKDADDNLEDAKLIVEIYTNDQNLNPTQISTISVPPYQANMTNFQGRVGTKRWYKMFVNQTANFIQFKVKNTQSGVRIKIHAIMPGFMPCGRII